MEKIEQLYHLARPAEGQDFLEAPALEVAARALAKEKASAPPIDLTGRTIAHYRILEKVGEGGMGVVYRAEDSKLGRQVAIKVLGEAFASDEERLARFAREARLLASLDHKNIAAIHGLEELEGKPFLVLELAEGKTLAERLKRGPIPLDETLDICRQIAEGLEAAHGKGIVHRDLKPANVKISREGKVKILDFGLARAMQDQAAAGLTHSPTITEEMTRPGVVLGTAAYMSPEQARGRTADKRADIWAFGCILFECLTGRRAFQGETITEMLAAILKNEPDWTLLSAETHPFVRAVLRQCLQKDLSLRLHDIADARLEIQEALFEPTRTVHVSQRFARGLFLSVAAATLVIGILIGWAVTHYSSPATLAGNLAVANAEVLSGLALIELAYPGAPVFYAAAQTVMDLRSGAYTGGGPEDFLFGAASNALADFYNVPLSMGSFATGAKEPNWQAGVENCLSTFMASAVVSDMLLGAGLLNGSTIWSCEQMIMDCEIFGIIARMMEGIVVNDEHLALEAIRDVGPGGSYMTHEHTLRHMRELWINSLMDRRPYSEWEKKRDGARSWALARARKILEAPTSALLDPKVEAELQRIIRSIEDE